MQVFHERELKFRLRERERERERGLSRNTFNHVDMHGSHEKQQGSLEPLIGLLTFRLSSIALPLSSIAFPYSGVWTSDPDHREARNLDLSTTPTEQAELMQVYLSTCNTMSILCSSRIVLAVDIRMLLFKVVLVAWR